MVNSASLIRRLDVVTTGIDHDTLFTRSTFALEDMRFLPLPDVMSYTRFDMILGSMFVNSSIVGVKLCMTPKRCSL